MRHASRMRRCGTRRIASATNVASAGGVTLDPMPIATFIGVVGDYISNTRYCCCGRNSCICHGGQRISLGGYENRNLTLGDPSSSPISLLENVRAATSSNTSPPFAIAVSRSHSMRVGSGLRFRAIRLLTISMSARPAGRELADR